MKHSSILTFALPLLLSLPGAPLAAQDAENPFRKASAEASPRSPAVAGSFVSLTEHILVPGELLDPWLDSHPLQGDAAELRRAVGEWIAQGKAKLDHTDLTAASATAESSHETILEQIYATEYEPPEPGDWPAPTAFETRNVGYTATSGVRLADGALTLEASIVHVRVLPSTFWNPLVERTRQPSDVFIPHFRQVEVTRRPAKPRPAPGADPTAAPPPAPADPFAPSDPELEAREVKSEKLLFAPGRVYLTSRSDEDLEQAAGGQVRLIFFRGAIRDESPELAPAAVPENYQLSCRLYRVDHSTASAWLQQQKDLTDLSASAWQAVEGWTQKGQAKVIGNLSGSGRGGSANTIENRLEVTYPTEWEPTPRSPAPDGKGTIPEFFTPTSFETRNTGLSADAALRPDERGLVLRLDLQRTMLAGYSIHHRILRDSEWQPNMTMPRFVTNQWKQELRVNRGKWQLVGTASELKDNGDFDSDHCVFAFVKVE